MGMNHLTSLRYLTDSDLDQRTTAEVVLETVDEDCSKFIFWEFGCVFKVI